MTKRIGFALLLALAFGLGSAAWAAEPEQLLRTTSAGQPVKIRDHGLTLGCEGVPPVITFTQQPAHGSVDIRPSRFVFAKGYVTGTTKTCEGQNVDGIAIWYTPAAGFHGVDQIAWLADFGGSHGKRRVDPHAAQITVQ